MTVRAFAAIAFAFAASVTFCMPPKAFAQDSMATPTLYKQLGGYDAIAAVSNDFITRLATDPKLSRFFVGLNDKHKAQVTQRVVEFLCAKTGGPCIYTGTDMKVTHAGLHITDDDWNAMLGDFAQTAAKFNIPANLQKQIGDFFTSLKPDIVTGP
ncbi:MAG: group 1 truncated hemoglobin [Candidatus Tumulicola sp.]